MHLKPLKKTLVLTLAIGATAIGWAQTTPPKTAPAPPVQPTNQRGAVFRATSNYHYFPLYVRDKTGQFVPDLKATDFRVYEDGIPQTIGNFLLNLGGRVVGGAPSGAGVSGGPAPVQTEGLILPPARRTNDASGRIFVIFIDDLHIQASESPRVREVLKQFRDTVLHENDLILIRSTGPSNIAVAPTYDYGHRRFDEAANKVMGAALSTMEIIKGAATEADEGPASLRYMTHTAFTSAYDMLDAIAAIPDRRKSFIYVSDGYDYDPFTQARYNQIQKQYAEAGINDPNNTNDPNSTSMTSNPALSSSSADFSNPTGISPGDLLADDNYRKKTEFSQSDLLGEIAGLVRAAKLAGATFYTVDPRGLMTGVELELPQEIAYSDTRDHMLSQNNTLKVIAEETGGFCTCQMNDFKKAFQRIDNETSDYYVIGYNATNSDPMKIRRQVRVEVTRPGLDVQYPPEYMLMRPKGK